MISRLLVSHAGDPGLDGQAYIEGLWWRVLAVAAPGESRQEDQELRFLLFYIAFEARLGHTKVCLKTNWRNQT